MVNVVNKSFRLNVVVQARIKAIGSRFSWSDSEAIRRAVDDYYERKVQCKEV